MAQRQQQEEILRFEKLTISFTQYEAGSTRKRKLSVISDLCGEVRQGEVVAVVGSSGSGKSLLAHAVFGLLPQNAEVSGDIFYRGTRLSPKDIERLRGRELALVPQGVSYLDPLMKTGRQILNGRRDAAAREKMQRLFGRYGLEKEVEQQYPFELSGGMARRVLLMTALMSEPKLIVADEPTTGMDFSLAAKAMEDFRSFADEGNGVLLITHDLKLALTAADRVLVFYAGTTVEAARAEDFKDESLLRHPYTRALYRALPEHGFKALPGTQPYAGDMPKGCPFLPRCPQADGLCAGEIPMIGVRGGFVRCVRYARTGLQES